MWNIMMEKIEKAALKVENFNTVALPKVTAEMEMTKRKFEEDSLEMKNHIDKMIGFEEFDKFVKSLRYEIEKTHSNIKILTENSEKVEEYLDHYLPIETFGMISETVSYLDPKIASRFIDFDQQKFETLKLEIEFEFLDIDGLSKRALEFYEDGQKRRELLKAAVINAIKKERKSIKKNLKHLKNPEKNEIHSKKESFSKNTFDKLVNGHTQDKQSEKKQENQLFIEKHVETLRIADYIREDSAKVPIREATTLGVNEDRLVPGKSRKSLIQINEKPVNLYFPLPSRMSSRKSLSNMNSDDSNSDNQSVTSVHYNKFSPESSGSVDPVKLENDLATIRRSVAALEKNQKSIEETAENTKKRLETSLQQFSQDLASNFAMIHGEIKLLLQKNKQNKVDLGKTLKNYQQDLKEREKIIEKVEQQFTNVSELVSQIVEFNKGIHLILSKEEEDRENLNLIGFSENSSKSNPKSYLSLKPECITCSGNNTIITSAFKMACINYNPSPLKYNSSIISKKQLIKILGSYLSDS